MSRPNRPWYFKDKDCWYIDLRGKRTNLGVKGKGGEAAAWAAFQTLLQKPAIAPESTPTALTVKEAADQFFAACALSLKPKTVERYRFDVGVFVKARSTTSLRSVTPDLVRKWVTAIKGTSTTKAIMLRSVSAFLGWCVREDKLDFNPVSKVKRPRTASRSDKALISDTDHQRLLAGATKEFAEVLTVLHGTGCRPGELKGITAESFNAEVRVVVISEHKTDRNGKPRLVFLTPALTELLSAKVKKHPTGPLLRSRKGVAWTGISISHAMCDLKKRVGVTAIAYGYRHGFVTDGLKAGRSNSQMAALVGHTSTAVIDRFYSHLGAAGDALREALKFRDPPKEKTPDQTAEGEK